MVSSNNQGMCRHRYACGWDMLGVDVCIEMFVLCERWQDNSINTQALPTTVTYVEVWLHNLGQQPTSKQLLPS